MKDITPDIQAAINHLLAADHHHKTAAENARLAMKAIERAAKALRENPTKGTDR